ncbi:hypothetical protein QQ045_025253 [Rhodiola kirilowii]
MDMAWMLVVISPVVVLVLIRLIKAARGGRRDQQCYLLNYKCFKAPDDRRVDVDTCAKIILRNKNLGMEEFRFLLRAIVSSGIGEHTFAPKIVIDGHEEFPRLDEAVAEMDEIIFTTLDQLFESYASISPKDIDILVVNVSSIATTPSLTARVINRYKMRDDVKVFNLTGMGCSASLVAIDMVQHLFNCYKNKLAVVVSTESMGPFWYCGKDRSMMLTNCLFRIGGCSMLLTNNHALRDKAKMRLRCSVRIHTGADDEAYNCCSWDKDEMGYDGFRLTKSLPRSGVKALIENFKLLLPKMLPLKELLRYIAVTYIRKEINPKLVKGMKTKPDIKTGVDHFCIHPGGKAVIDEMGKNFELSEYDVEPARMTLHRFGNTSSSAIWYVLGYMEAKKRLKKGNKILMIGLGSGFKCNTCVWEVTKDLTDRNVWDECIDIYPRKVDVSPFAEKFGWITDQCIDLLSEKDVDDLRDRYARELGAY